MDLTPGLCPSSRASRTALGASLTTERRGATDSLRTTASHDRAQQPFRSDMEISKLDGLSVSMLCLPSDLPLSREPFARSNDDAVARGDATARPAYSPPSEMACVLTPRAASTSGLSDTEMGEQLGGLLEEAARGAGDGAAPLYGRTASNTSQYSDVDPSDWATVPDGVLQEVMKYMSSSYIRRVRLVCNGWACFAGRFCTELKPEFLPAGGVRLAQRFPYLRVLDLSHCSEIVIHAKAHNELRLQSSLTDESLAHLTPLQRLEELSLKGCAGLAGPGLRHLAALPNLQRLDLQACTRLTNKGLEHVAQMKRLTHLNLRDCRLLTNDGLRRLAPVKGLKSLALSNASGVTDKGLQCLAQLTGLEHFAISRCPYVTDRGFSALLLQPLPCLKRIVVRRCPGVTESGLRAIAELKKVEDGKELMQC